MLSTIHNCSLGRNEYGFLFLFVLEQDLGHWKNPTMVLANHCIIIKRLKFVSAPSLPGININTMVVVFYLGSGNVRLFLLSKKIKWNIYEVVF